MGFEKEAVTVKERAAEREQGLVSSIENLRRETGGTNIAGTAISEISTLPSHEVQVKQSVQILTNPIVNEGGNKGDTADSKTWKERTDKRKSDKKR